MTKATLLVKQLL